MTNGQHNNLYDVWIQNRINDRAKAGRREIRHCPATRIVIRIADKASQYGVVIDDESHE